MEFVDTHCHIQSAGNKSRAGERSTAESWAKQPELTAAGLLEDAVLKGVHDLICVGCDLADSQLAVSFAQSQSGAWASIGVHPHEAKDFVKNEPDQTAFTALATAPKVIAIGECGLDYYYEHSPKADQLIVLRFQIELALKHDLPIIFHVREAYDDFWPIFESYEGIRGVLHSYTDSIANLERAVSHGLYIGVNGIATFAKQPAQLDMYRAIPIGNLLLETDAPFLTPTPYRGSINEPKHVATVASFLATLRDSDNVSIAAATTANAHSLFSLK